MQPPASSPYDMDALKLAFSDLKCETDPGQILKKSRDFYWYSPVLKARLDSVCADLVVSPRNESEVRHVLETCYRLEIPVTTRGTGTGNYGQAMPLSGGVVLNMQSMAGVVDVSPGRVSALPGTVIQALDRHTIEASCQEVRLFPSTYKSASIGGFVAGGSGGVGSITWGGLRDLGNILGLKLMTMEASPRLLTLTGEDIQKANHAYGTTGIITEVEMPLAPAYNWVDVMVGFSSFADAARYANDLSRQDALLKKLVSVVAAPVPYDYFTRHRPFLRRDHHVVLLMIAEHAMGAFETFHQRTETAEILFRSDQPHNIRGLPPLYELSWNHTTLRALQVDASVTYLQVLYPFGDHLTKIQTIHNQFGDELPGHLEFVRFDGDITCFGLPLLRYHSEARLQEIIRYHEDHGCPIFNPHRYTLEEGGMKQTDRAQLAFKHEADPKGLLNPGKMLAWDDPDFDFSTDKMYLFPGLAPRQS